MADRELLDHLRAFLDEWDEEVGGRCIRRSWRGTALLASDLRALLSQTEGDHMWAVCRTVWDEEDGIGYNVAQKTFPTLDGAEAALPSFGPGHCVCFWDDNGIKSCWRMDRKATIGP